MQQEVRNEFGGYWTEQKISIFMKYVHEYLKIMNKYNFKLLYFDGFAGCGTIDSEGRESALQSVALSVLAINQPKRFDYYYLVDKKKKNALQLQQVLSERFPDIKNRIYVRWADCNEKLVAMCSHMKRHKNIKSLVFLDPFGMSMNWASIEECRGLGIDLWILVPTGIGMNRLLTKDGNISKSWMKKITSFTGLSEDTIREKFYKRSFTNTLFGIESEEKKQEDAIKVCCDIYVEQLKQVWQHVSKPFEMKNTRGHIIYHFIFATNVPAGVKIADYIIGKQQTS